MHLAPQVHRRQLRFRVALIQVCQPVHQRVHPPPGAIGLTASPQTLKDLLPIDHLGTELWHPDFHHNDHHQRRQVATALWAGGTRTGSGGYLLRLRRHNSTLELGDLVIQLGGLIGTREDDLAEGLIHIVGRAGDGWRKGSANMVVVMGGEDDVFLLLIFYNFMF